MQIRKRLSVNMSNQKGFTLIEMVIVLIIIGIIIGAVVKGKDIMKSAELKKFYTKYLQAWQVSYLTFYDRTGMILGDTWDGTATGQDGQADTAAGVTGAPTDAGRADLFDGGTVGAVSFLGLSQVGLSAPASNTANNYQYNYADSAGGAHTIDIAFLWDDTNKYNYMVINNIPTELAIAMDTMVDGVANGSTGDFLNGAGAAWSTAATVEIDGVRWKMQF